MSGGGSSNLEVIANAIKSIGIEYTYGIVGVPITNLVIQVQKQGIPFYGFRNEQACSYGASVVGYLTRKPAIVFTVSGPGLVHAIPGAINATSNCWPLLVVSSSPNPADLNRGGFQECPQVELSNHRGCFKSSYVLHSIDNALNIFQSAYNDSINGRPGAVYIQLPANILQSTIPTSITLPFPSSSSQQQPMDLSNNNDNQNNNITILNQSQLINILELLYKSKRPLIIGGKGAAYARAEGELRKFVEFTNIPFLSSPMGKGLLADNDSRNVSSARSVALKQADMVFVIGARLNWMFGYGQPPTFSAGCRFIVLDICPEQPSTNLSPQQLALSVVGDAKQILSHLNQILEINREGLVKPLVEMSEWWNELNTKARVNIESLYKLMNQPQMDGEYLTYHQVFNVISKYLPEDSIVVNEGANTMDIGRVCIGHTHPRCRLDAGTLSTMGVGVGYAIAAQSIYQNNNNNNNNGQKYRFVTCIQGDSAFGFSGMEVEVACRYNLPILFIVINNNGIYEGLESIDDNISFVNKPLSIALPPTSLTPKSKYELLIQSFGGIGYSIDKLSALEELIPKLISHLQSNSISRVKPILLNIYIKPSSLLPKILSSNH